LPPARSAYLHVPFCARRCGYCNFTLVAGREDLLDAYLQAIERELQALGAPHPVETLFFGGGTPTLLPLPQLAQLLELVRRWLPLAGHGEWSCEANPLDCTADKLQLLRAAGVNRVSLGGQSFSDRKLRVLERDHGGGQLLEAIARVSDLFDNWALDLIFAAPDETLQEWQRDLDEALRCQPRHISTYGLTIEKGSAFFARQLHGDLRQLEESLELEMYRESIARFTASGYEHYEVSNFAQPDWRCRHNEAYWLGRPWLAFGPGAAAFDGQERTVNHRSTTTYIRRVLAGRSPVAEREVLSPAQRLREAFVFGLRRLEGVDLATLATLAAEDGSDLPATVELLLEPYLSRAVEAGWLQRDGTRIRLTEAGLVISDSLWPDFLGDA
jgi:oxygen-independent coproporphyrinogen III oxidase